MVRWLNRVLQACGERIFVTISHLSIFLTHLSNIHVADGEKVMTGTSCSHLFHYECAMQWLCKKHHYHCPYCRKDMLTNSELRKAAEHVLGVERMEELAQHSILASAMFPPDTLERAESRSTSATPAPTPVNS